MMKNLFFLFLFVAGISNAQIVNIPDANFKAKLIASGVDTNNDGNIQQSEALASTHLEIGNSNISSLTGIASFTNLLSLNCENNLITQLDVSTSPGLNHLWCQNNQLTYLNVSGLTLAFLHCFNNQLATLNLSTTNITGEFRCQSNLLTSLDLNGKQFSTALLSNNLFNVLDLSTCTNLNTITCDNNPNLTTLNLKNGRNENGVVSENVPNLAFVCIDESQANALMLSFLDPSVVVNSYCDFDPGGNYNTIRGAVTFDANANGCNVSDAPWPNMKLNINNGISQGAAFSNTNGNYTFYTDAGNYTVTPIIENPSWFTFSPPNATIPFASNNNTTTVQNFCLSVNGVHNDVEVVLLPIAPARPGFDAIYNIVYKNKGNQILSGAITMSYNDAVLDFTTASLLPNAQATGLLTWNYTTLQPFESRSFYVTLNVNSPVEIPSVNIGDVLPFQVVVTPTIGDENADDNTFSYNQTIVGSYDPNDKTCMQGAVLLPSEIGKYLHYAINFENTGTAPATFVVVSDEIDGTKFDIASLSVMHSSHPMTVRVTGNKIEFIFQNINLGAGQHGNVVFKIKSNNTLVDGDTVANRANIYFDYNFPVITNFANTIYQSLNATDFEADDSLIVYPNPATSIITVRGDFQINSLQLFDIQGRLIQASIENTANVSLDISQRQSGTYFLKITSENGTKTVKVIRE